MRYRRLARDYERTIAHHEAMVYWATVFIMTKRLTRYETGQPQPERWGGQRSRLAQQAALSTGSKRSQEPIFPPVILLGVLSVTVARRTRSLRMPGENR
jgi:hypothetical protein